jgi:hypothetical protein
MKIECVLKRKGGTHVEMPGKKYHFAAQDDGRHIAEVENTDHIERFLAIPEAYRIARAPGSKHDQSQASASLASTVKLPDAPPQVLVDPNALRGSSSHPQTVQIGTSTYALADVVLRAFQDSGLTLEDWNDLDDEARATKIDIVLDGIDDGEIVLTPSAPEDDRVQLAAKYQAAFGRMPPGNMKTETIKAKLAVGAE